MNDDNYPTIIEDGAVRYVYGPPPKVVAEVVVPEDGDPAPDVGPDPVVLPRAAVCNNWERWTEDE